MSSTDDRIVRMQFDNAQFKKGAADTAKSLADLDKATAAAGKSKGLMDMNTQMGTVSVTASKMAVITTTALATITTKVVDTGIQMAKALTFDPIKQGFFEYEELLTKQNTIMNATGKSAKEVKGYLTELNTYSDQTIYSFSNMTASIAKFVNAGISLPDSVKSIKGIANAAAFAGASTEEANRAMYAFSQSMGTGYLMLNDWMQIENANMGTVRFKEELLEAAVAAGTLTKQGNQYITTSGKAVSATKGWREGLQEQWATTEVMNTALAKYTDLNTKLGREATKSAQEVRTFTAFMDTLKESIGSGWASIFTSLIGNLEQATKFWTGFSESIGGGVDMFFNFISAALKTWRKMGGFEKTLAGISNILAPFGALLGVVGDAWRKAFPDSGSGSGKALYALSSGFELLTRPLKIFAEVIEGTTPVMVAFFRVIRIFGSVISTVAGSVTDFVRNLVEMAGMKVPSSGGFVSFIKDIAREIGSAIEQIDKLIQKGASIGSAFGSVDISLPNMPSLPSLPSLSGAAAGPSDKAQAGFAGMASSVKDLTNNVLNLNSAADKTGGTTLFATADSDVFRSFGDSVDELKASAEGAGPEVETMGDKFSSAWDNIMPAMEKFGSFLKDLASRFNFEDIMASFNLAVLSTMGITFARFMNQMTKAFQGFGPIMEGAGGYLQSFQTAAKAQLILNIAIALGVLAASMWLLSTIPAGKMGKALVGLTGAVVLMSVAMAQISKTVDKMDGKGVNLKLIAVSIAVTALGIAILTLAIAFRVMNGVDWQSILKGLITMVVVMKVVEQLGNLGKGTAGNMLAGAAAISIVAVSMGLLAGALLLFKLVDWGAMGKAGAALGGIALAVGLLALIPYEGIAKVGLALLTASLGVESMARAMLIFGLVEWESIGKAAVALGILTLALAGLMYVGNPVTVAGMVSMAGAIVLLAGAMLILNSVDWSSLFKLGAVFAVLIGAFAGFMAVVSVFSPAIILLSAFAGSLGFLALALTGLAAAFALILPLLAVGVGAFAAFATGAAVAFAVFVTTLAAEAPIIKKAFLDMLQVLIDGIVEAVPMMIQGIKRLWAAVAKEFNSGDKKKASGDAGKSWVASAADGIQAKLPEITDRAISLLVNFLKAVTSRGAELGAAGAGLIVSLLQGIGSKVGQIVEAAVDLIIKFAKGIGDGLGRIVEAGIQLIADFLHRLASAIRGGSGAIGGGLTDVLDAMKDVGMDIVRGMISGIGEMFDDAMGAIGDLAGGMVDKAKGILKIWSPSRVFKDIGKFLVQGLTLGVQNNAASAITAVAAMLTGTIALATTMVDKALQKLDQRTLAAQARAEGLTAAARQAQKAANKTKTRDDDQAANKLSRQAKKARKEAAEAAKEERRAEQRKRRREEWEAATLEERAQIKSDAAKQALAGSRKAEKDAERARVQAEALERQSRAKGLTKEQREKFRKDAERLRKQAREDARRANRLLNNARDRAEEALVQQQLAGEEAAKLFQEQYEAEAKADADAEAFEKLTSAQKAEQRKKEAEELQKQADENLAKAKELAFTDISAANDMAALALEQAERARALLDESKDYLAEGGSGQVLDLSPTLAAAQAIADYEALYESALAAAAGTTVNFTQNNTSPESLSDAEIYRQTHNLVTYAADKIGPSVSEPAA